MQGSPLANPRRMATQPSSLPMKHALARVSEDLADAVRRERGVERHRHMAAIQIPGR